MHLFAPSPIYLMVCCLYLQYNEFISMPVNVKARLLKHNAKFELFTNIYSVHVHHFCMRVKLPMYSKLFENTT